MSYISLPISSCPHTSSLSLKQNTAAAIFVVCAVLCDLSQWLMGLEVSVSGSFSTSTMKLREKNNQWAQKRMKEFKTRGSYNMLLRLQNRDATAEIVKDVNEWRWKPQQGLPGPWHNPCTLLFWVPWRPLKLPNKPPSIVLAFKIFFLNYVSIWACAHECRCPWKPEEVVRSPDSRLTSIYDKPPHVGARNQIQILCHLSALLLVLKVKLITSVFAAAVFRCLCFLQGLSIIFHFHPG